MNRFYFNPTSYVDIEIIHSTYLSNTTKFKFTFYESLIERASILFDDLHDLVNSICILFCLKEGLVRDPYDSNLIYVSNPNEYGENIELIANYIPVPNIPTEEDDNVNIHIAKNNQMLKKRFILFSTVTENHIIEELIQYLILFLESNSIYINTLVDEILPSIEYKGDYYEQF